MTTEPLIFAGHDPVEDYLGDPPTVTAVAFDDYLDPETDNSLDPLTASWRGALFAVAEWVFIFLVLIVGFA